MISIVKSIQFVTIMLMVGFLFTINLAFPSQTGTITLAWDTPTENSDGTPLFDLAGYKLYYDNDQAGEPYNGIGLPEGDSPITISLFSLTDQFNPEFVLTLVPSGTYYIVVTAYDDVLNESNYSNEITGSVIDSIAPGEVVIHTVTVTVP